MGKSKKLGKGVSGDKLESDTPSLSPREILLHEMTYMIDLLASEYHWTRDQILDYPLDEFFLILDHIKNRKRNEEIRQLNIVSYPHIEEKSRKEYINSLKGDGQRVESLPEPKKFDQRAKNDIMILKSMQNKKKML